MYNDGLPTSNFNSIGFNLWPFALECVKEVKKNY